MLYAGDTSEHGVYKRHCRTQSRKRSTDGLVCIGLPCSSHWSFKASLPADVLVTLVLNIRVVNNRKEKLSGSAVRPLWAFAEQWHPNNLLAIFHVFIIECWHTSSLTTETHKDNLFLHVI